MEGLIFGILRQVQGYFATNHIVKLLQVPDFQQCNETCDQLATLASK